MRYFGGRILFSATALAGALLVLGCGGDSGVGKLLDVRGSLTLDDEPLTATSTVVLFEPDASKGNASRFEPAGTVDEQGNYTLLTEGRPGAPPGRYRVIVAATQSPPDSAQRSPNQRPVPRSLVPAKYGQAATTELMIEVVENPAPGAYDLKLAK